MEGFSWVFRRFWMADHVSVLFFFFFLYSSFSAKKVFFGCENPSPYNWCLSLRWDWHGNWCLSLRWDWHEYSVSRPPYCRGAAGNHEGPHLMLWSCVHVSNKIRSWSVRSAKGLTKSVDLHACVDRLLMHHTQLQQRWYEWSKKGLRKNKSRTKERLPNRGGGVPTHHYSVVTMTLKKMRPDSWTSAWQRLDAVTILTRLEVERLTSELHWRMASTMSLQDCSFRVWTCDAKSSFDGNDTGLSVSGPLSECRLDADKRLSPFAVILLFAGLLSPLMKTSWTRTARSRSGECDGRGVLTETCHSNGAGRPTQRGAWCELTNEYE